MPKTSAKLGRKVSKSFKRSQRVVEGFLGVKGALEAENENLGATADAAAEEARTLSAVKVAAQTKIDQNRKVAQGIDKLLNGGL